MVASLTIIKDNIYVLTMTNGENRFNPAFVSTINAQLDAIQKQHLEKSGPAALILRGEGKFFSNGLDLAWMGANSKEVKAFMESLHKLFARLMVFPMLTIACMNGHAFAGGAMLAVCCDLRVMNEKAGFFCLPEIDLNMSLTHGMNDLLAVKLSPAALRDSLLLGKRLTSQACLSLAIIDVQAPDFFEASVALAEKVRDKSKNAVTLHTLKYKLYEPAMKSLNAPTKPSVSHL